MRPTIADYHKEPTPIEIINWPLMSNLVEITPTNSRQISHARRHLKHFHKKLAFDDIVIDEMLGLYRRSKDHMRCTFNYFVICNHLDVKYGRYTKI